MIVRVACLSLSRYLSFFFLFFIFLWNRTSDLFVQSAFSFSLVLSLSFSPSFFLSRSLRSLSSYESHVTFDSHAYVNIFFRFLSHALACPQSHSRKICQKYSARKDGEGRKFRNNLHLQTGLIISSLKTRFS